MRYWNDPFHASLVMGDMMLHSILGVSDKNKPDNFFLIMTEKNVASHILNKREAVTAWAKTHTEFVEQLNIEKLAWEKSTKHK